MDLRLFDPEELPRPRAEVRVRTAAVEPYPDGRRVRVSATLTAFRERPSLDISLRNPDGEVVSTLSIIETVTPTIQLTMHVRAARPGQGYTARFVLYYPPSRPAEGEAPSGPDEIVHTYEAAFELPSPRDESAP